MTGLRSLDVAPDYWLPAAVRFGTLGCEIHRTTTNWQRSDRTARLKTIRYGYEGIAILIRLRAVFQRGSLRRYNPHSWIIGCGPRDLHAKTPRPTPSPKRFQPFS